LLNTDLLNFVPSTDVFVERLSSHSWFMEY